MGPIVAVGCGALVCSWSAYALFRWREHIARGTARIEYQIQSRLRRSLRWRFRWSPGLWRAVVLAGAAALAALALALWVAVGAFVVAAATGSLPAPTRREIDWAGARAAIRDLATLCLVYGVFLLATGTYWLVDRLWTAQVIRWYWDTALPVDAPYPGHAAARLESADAGYASAAARAGLAMILIGLVCLLAGVAALLA